MWVKKTNRDKSYWKNILSRNNDMKYVIPHIPVDSFPINETKLWIRTIVVNKQIEIK